MAEKRQRMGIKPLFGRQNKRLPEIGDKGVAEKTEGKPEQCPVTDAKKVLLREWSLVSNSTGLKKDKK